MKGAAKPVAIAGYTVSHTACFARKTGELKYE
jgi:hypothetical protein